jgi:hypothetical protein
MTLPKPQPLPTFHADELASSPEARELPIDATLRAQPNRLGGLCVKAVHGTVLVTQAGDPRDHVLSAGETFRAAPRGLVVAWALKDAAVRLWVRPLSVARRPGAPETLAKSTA